MRDIVFYNHTDYYHCFIFVSSYLFYHQIHINTHMRCFAIALINLSLWLRYFQVHVFHFIRDTYSTTLNFDNITVPIRPIHASSSEFKSISVGLTMHGCFFCSRYLHKNLQSPRKTKLSYLGDEVKVKNY